MKKSKTIAKIMISGYYGFNNTGDDAILKSMVRAFKEKIAQVKITVLSHSPLQTSQTYQVKSINRLHLINIICCLRDTNLFISGGGGLLQDSTGKGWSILYYLGLILVAKIVKIPVMIYAQGIGPVNNQVNKKLMKWILNKVELITVRDNSSKELLENLGVVKPSIYVNSDPVFLLKKKNINHVINIYPYIRELINPDDCPLIGVSVREYKSNGSDSKRIFAQAADYLIENYQAKIIFLPFQFDEDVHISEEILSLMKNQAEILKIKLEPEELLSVLSRLSLVIGVRLHSIIFSSMANIPFVAFSYDPKVKHFVEDLGLSELLLGVDEDISLKNIQEKVEYVRENNNKIKDILLKKVNNLEEKALANNELIYKFLNL
ncbi:polysaccharide pyruvyl transferase CsaB [Candidatus Atribacteria bacterium 1244-E10-H5-B2]|nr:MAG: polysaccharide pyruvyl transferase CsaB [Candidatus Atribacteria bacterium 1244-E10-H5-B2]